jgi:IS30 family transposase
MAVKRLVGRGRRLSLVERDVVLGALRAGASAEQAAERAGCSSRTVQRLFMESKVKSRRIGQSQLRLCFEEREQISRGLAAGDSARCIGRRLQRDSSTISREIAANGGKDRYRALRAHERAISATARPKPGKLAGASRLRSEVEAGLIARWSPRQISARLRVDHPDDLEMRISPETIYQSLYIQSRGELRRQLTANLRTGRTKRRPNGGEIGQRGKIKDMVLISERPAQIEDRAVPGHWEGDLIVGKNGRSFIATLVERQTRYVMLARLGSDRTTGHVTAALKDRIQQLPAHLALSLTWDQGKELSAHHAFSIQTGIDIYFCDPHSPWQRGSNENTNGLLRQYLPKSTDLAAHSQPELDHIAAELNGRPRETLGWMKPAEKMNELLMR